MIINAFFLHSNFIDSNLRWLFLQHIWQRKPGETLIFAFDCKFWKSEHHLNSITAKSYSLSDNLYTSLSVWLWFAVLYKHRVVVLQHGCSSSWWNILRTKTRKIIFRLLEFNCTTITTAPIILMDLSRISTVFLK